MSIKDYTWLTGALAKLPERLPGALLIYGQRGAGKQQLARAISQSLLCLNSAGPGFPCGTCEGCHLFKVGNHPDFRLLQPESDADEVFRDGAEKDAGSKKPSSVIGVDAVRDLAGLTATVAHRGGARVIMIAPAESLHISAGNALLKMLEEPGRDTYFILVTNERNRILATIRSRCFQLSVNVPADTVSTGWLESHDPGRAKVAFSLSSNAPFAARELALDDNFWAGRDAITKKLIDPTSNPVEIASAAESLEPAVLGRMLSMWVFDLLCLQQGGDVHYHRDMQAELQRLANTVKGADLCRWGDDVRDFSRAAAHPLNRRLALESLFARWPGSNQRLTASKL